MGTYASDVSPVANTVYKSNLNHGKKYQDLASANPYANPVYRESGWQKFLSSLGFRTDKDRYLEGMAIQAAEYDQALLEKEYNEKYDSPLAQAEREREAGLNPNLTGNVSAGESSPLADDGNPPQPSESDFDSAVQFASGIMDAVQVAYGLFGNGLSLASGMADLKNKRLQNDLVSMDVNSKLFDFAEDAVYRLRDKSSGFNPDGVTVENWYPALKANYGNLMSKRQFKKFVKLADRFSDNINSGVKLFTGLDEYTGKRKSFYNTAFNSSQYSDEDAVMAILSDELGSLATKAMTTKLQADSSKNRYDKDFYDNLDPNKMADALQTKSINEATVSGHNVGIASEEFKLKQNERSMSDFKLELRNTLRNIMNRLDGLIGNGNDFGSAVKAAIAGWVLKNLPSM